MSEAKDIELLADIARLLKKYGPKTFEDLAHQLSEGHLLDSLVSILDASAQSVRRSKGKPGGKRIVSIKPDGLTELITRIAEEEPDKAKVLKGIHEKLVAKSILSSLKAIRNFAEDNGLRPVKATSREKSILPLVRDLASLPLDRLDRIFSDISHLQESGERTLEGWSGIILGSNK